MNGAIEGYKEEKIRRYKIQEFCYVDDLLLETYVHHGD